MKDGRDAEATAAPLTTARYRAAMRVGRLVSWETDLARRTRTWSPEAIALFGFELSGLEGVVGGPDDELLRAIHPDDRDRLAAYHEHIRTNDHIDAEYRIVRPDGRIIHIAGRGEVTERDWRGRPRILVNVAADVTATVEADARAERHTVEIETAKARFEALVQASAQIVWSTRPDGMVREDSPSWRSFTGQTYAQWCGVGWLGVVHPDDRAATELAWRKALREEKQYVAEYRLQHRSGEYCWTVARGVPMRDASGRITEWVGMNEDISERKRRENDLRIVMRELSHRTKNLLAIIQSIARRTFHDDEAAGPAVKAFVDRLHGIAVSHDLLVGANWSGASLDDLVRAHLEPFADLVSAQIEMGGPHVLLKPEAAQNLGLALHELVTNAVKHGALSAAGGKLAISWQIDRTSSGPVLEFEWTEATSERAGHAVTRRGFGRQLLEEIVPRGASGGAVLRIDGGNVSWRLTAPISAVA